MDLRDQLQAHLGDAFLLERELGGGGMSRVFVATETRLSRRVAIKVLSPELVQGINAERFEREILLAASLQQANIVGVLAAGEVDGLPYFMMPFVEGESLRNRITPQGMPVAQVITIMREVAKALAYAHARGIVHRDIKPDNVLLSGGTAMVTDFGIAKALSASRKGEAAATLTSVGTSIGTPAYMAPEQVAGDPNIDHRVDLYALGCMAMELLTGRSPFADETPQRMLAAHLSVSAPSVESRRGDCPPALSRLIANLLAKDPNDRVQSAQEVLEALDDASTASSPTMSLSAPGMLPKALGMYAVATGAVAIVAKAAVVGIGLPEWTFPGAMIVMLFGLPSLLLTAYVKRVQRHAATATPTLTPGGTMAGRLPSGTMATIALKAGRHVSWKRTIRGGMYAMSGFVLLIVAFMVTRSLGVGPAASLFAAGTLAAEDKVVLANFTTEAQDTSLAPIIQAAVREAMSQSRAVRILGPAEVAATLVLMQRPTDTPLDASIVKEVAERANAKAILGGRLARAGTGYLISLDLTSAAQGTVLASFQGTADGVKDLLDVVDELTRKLRGKMGESLKQVANSVPLAQATTSSLEALRLYSEAVVANDIEADYDKAIRLTRKAVELDPTFALAWRKLNASLVNSNGPIAARDSALENANRYADKLPPLERQLVWGAMAMSHSTKADRGKALEIYRAAYAIDSSDLISTNQLMLLYSRRFEDDSALRYARRKVAINGEPSSAIRVVEMLTTAGRTEEAKRVVDSLATAAPEFAKGSFFRLNAAGVAYQLGDIARARVLNEAVIAEGSASDKIIALPFQATIEQATGRLSRASAMQASYDSLMSSRGRARVDGLIEAEADISFRGKLAEGVARLDRIVAGPQWAATPGMERPTFKVILLYTRAGAAEKAARLLAKDRAELPAIYNATANRQWLEILEGEIALASGQGAQAGEHFRRAMVAEDGAPSEALVAATWGLARAYDRAGQLDSARVVYQRLLARSAVDRVAADIEGIATAATTKRLGELYDAKGDRANAIKYYEAFVEQWKDADAELQPTVATVKKRLAELRQQGG